jgi:hypothetical protein
MEPNMSAIFEGGHSVDLILGLLILEFIILCAVLRRIAWRDLGFNLVSGACLLLALRQALTGATFVSLAICLLASFVFHIADVTQRIGVYPPLPGTSSAG